jgi:signal peptidase II
VKLLGGAVYLVHTTNTGAAFSVASGFTVVLTCFAIGVIVVIARMARRLFSSGWAVALGLVLGGATGNLVDRLFRAPGPFRGGVVDFISLFDPFSPPWPVFNVADSSLVVGVCLAVLLELRGRRIDGRHRNDVEP